VRAVTYVANRDCRLFIGSLDPREAAGVIAHGVGQMGANRDYLLNTVLHLREMGVRDAGLDRIVALLPEGGEDCPQDAAPQDAPRPSGTPGTSEAHPVPTGDAE
jgi:cation transport protein ChaC